MFIVIATASDSILEAPNALRIVCFTLLVSPQFLRAIVEYRTDVPLYDYIAIPHGQTRCHHCPPKGAWWDAQNQIVLELGGRDDWRPDLIWRWIEDLHTACFPHDTKHLLARETRETFSKMATMPRGEFRSEGGIGAAIGLMGSIRAYREIEALVLDPPWPLEKALIAPPTEIIRFLEQHKECSSVLFLQHNDL